MDGDSKKALHASLKEAWHKLDSQYEFYAKSAGLNFTTVLVLQILHDSKELYTQKDLCEKLGLPKQLVNSIITSFWQQGFVQLKEAKDRRNKNIIVTGKGKDYFASVLDPLEEAESAAWEDFSDEEMTSFIKTLEKYVASLERVLKVKKIYEMLNWYVIICQHIESVPKSSHHSSILGFHVCRYAMENLP